MNNIHIISLFFALPELNNVIKKDCVFVVENNFIVLEIEGFLIGSAAPHHKREYGQDENFPAVHICFILVV